MASRAPDPFGAYEPRPLLPVQAAEAPATLGWTDSSVWSAAWKQSGAQEDWGLNQQRYMSSAIEKISGELRKRGHRLDDPVITPAAVVSRNMRGKPRVLPMARPGDALWRTEQFWKTLADEQAKDPSFLPEYSGVRDWEGLYNYAIGQRKADSADADDILTRASTSARVGTSLATGLGHALTDPTSYIPIPGAGPSGSVARTVISTGLREAGANIVVGAAMEPFVRADAAALGKERTMGDTALDLAIQGGAGLVLGGAGGLLQHYTGRRAVDRATVDGFRAAVPQENWTPDERAAVNVVEREADIVEKSPYLPNKRGDATHLDKMADSFGLAITSPPAPVPVVRRSPLDPAAQFRAPAAQAFMARVRTAESSGNDAAQAATSSAYGRYQFTKGTWTSYFKRRYPDSGLSDADILAKRRDGAMQDLLMGDLTADNSRRLRQAGIEVTPTSLYAAHFAGPADAVRILSADRAAPMESVMDARSIAANSWLRGKTVGEFLAIMDRKMGGEGHVSPRDVTAAPSEIAEAPVAPEEPMVLRDHEADADGLMDSDYAQLDPAHFRTSEEHARAQLRDMADADAREGFDIADMQAGQWRRTVEQLSRAQGGEALGALDHPDLGAIDVKWGEAGDPNDKWKGGYGLSHILAKHPEIVEQLPDLIGRMAIVEQRSERAILASQDHRAAVALTWHGEDQRWLLSAYKRDATPDGPTSQRGSMDDGTGSSRPGVDTNIGPAAPSGNPAHFRAFIDRQAGTPNWVVASKMSSDLRQRGFDTVVPPRQFAAMRENWEAMSPQTREQFAPSSQASMTHVDPPAIEPGSSDAKAIDQSLEHDLRMALENPDIAGMMIYEDGGEPRTVAQIIEEIDADDDARAALIACMKPAKKGA